MNEKNADVIIVQATPAGIMAAIASARRGRSVILTERSAHLGGLPANGLGATDIGQRGATGGYFDEYRRRILHHYRSTYGVDSVQVRHCDEGHKFEPSVAETIFEDWLAEYADRITVLRLTQFDAHADQVECEGSRIRSIRVQERTRNTNITLRGEFFVDASYEGDLSAAAGLPYRLGRESADEFHEPVAGRVYRAWHDPRKSDNPGEGDDLIQAYNYRLCLTRDPEKRVQVPRPDSYDRSEYLSLIDDIEADRWAGIPAGELELHGIGRLVNIVMLPNGLSDANNQHLSFLSTDLPEENVPWPTADWAWRDQFAERLRDYILGLLWFAQNDEDVPESFRAACREWGLARTQYEDNGHMPRQVYVREGRRIMGNSLFTAHDTLPVDHLLTRPPIHRDSVTASHYALDSHACLKREPGKPHLEGFFSYRNQPYTVPYGVMVNRKLDNLIFPVPVSATHVGFSTLRMEPCWMALGQAAGVAIDLAIRGNLAISDIPIRVLQANLLSEGAVLVHYQDIGPGDPGYAALQLIALQDTELSTDWTYKPHLPVRKSLVQELRSSGWEIPEQAHALSRQELCIRLTEQLPVSSE